MFCENCVNAALGAGFSKHLAVGAAEPVNVDALARSSARDTLLVSRRDSSTQCCGSGMFIPDPGSKVKKILSPEPHQRNFSIFSLGKLFLNSRKYVHPDGRRWIRKTAATFSWLCLFNVHHSVDLG
jgi:hypothetical protein